MIEKLYKLTMTDDPANWELYYQLIESLTDVTRENVIEYFLSTLDTMQPERDGYHLKLKLPFGKSLTYVIYQIFDNDYYTAKSGFYFKNKKNYMIHWSNNQLAFNFNMEIKQIIKLF